MKTRESHSRHLGMGGAIVLLLLSTTATPARTTVDTEPPRPARPPEFIYSANQAAENISGYRIDLKNGKLVTLPGSPFSSGRYPVAITMSPDHRFVYATNQGSASISAYAVDPNNGDLHPVSGSPFKVGMYPDSITITPDERFAYVTNEDSNIVNSYKVDPDSGALTKTGHPVSTGAHP